MTAPLQYQQLAQPLPGYPAVGGAVTMDAWEQLPPIPTRRSKSLVRRLGHFTINLEPLGSPDMDIPDAEVVSAMPDQPSKIRRKATRATSWLFDLAPPIPSIPEVMSVAAWMPRNATGFARSITAGTHLFDLSPMGPTTPLPEISTDPRRRPQPGQARDFIFEPTQPEPEPQVAGNPLKHRPKKNRRPGAFAYNPVPEIVPDIRQLPSRPPIRRRTQGAGTSPFDPIPETRADLRSISTPEPRRRTAQRTGYLPSLRADAAGEEFYLAESPGSQPKRKPRRVLALLPSALLDFAADAALPKIQTAPVARPKRQRPAGLFGLDFTPIPKPETCLELPPLNPRRLHQAGAHTLDVLPIPDPVSVPEYFHTQPQSRRKTLSHALRSTRSLQSQPFTSGGRVVGVQPGLSLSWIYLDAAQSFVPGFDAAQVIGGMS